MLWGGAGASVRKRAEWAVGLGTPSAAAARGLCSGSWSGCPGKAGRGRAGRGDGAAGPGHQEDFLPWGGQRAGGAWSLRRLPVGGLGSLLALSSGHTSSCSDLPCSRVGEGRWTLFPHFAVGEPGPRSRDLAGRAWRGLGLCRCPAHHVGLSQEPSDLRELSCRSEVCGLLASERGFSRAGSLRGW